MLDKISIAEARYYWSGNRFLPQPVIGFKVTNGTGVPLSRIYYHGTVTTPGRSVARIDENFNHEIAGSLEPGETKRLQLSPNMFSGWCAKDTQGRTDLVFTVKAVNAEGADRAKLATTFGKAESERLAKLAAMKVELEKTLPK